MLLPPPTSPILKAKMGEEYLIIPPPNDLCLGEVGGGEIDFIFTNKQ